MSTGNTTPIIPTDQLANGTTLSIKVGTESSYKVIANCENINIPDQAYNAIEANIINAKDGIKPRLLGSRAGGDLTFKVDVLDATDEGLIALITAYKGKLACEFKATYPSGVSKIIPQCKVQKCANTDHSLDALIAYDCSCIVNGLVSEEAAS